jgi:uncharacterized membrane protein YbhN (UPF0104 family)
VSRWRNIPRRWLIASQALLSVTLVLVLVYGVDWRGLFGAFRQVSPAIVAVGVGVYFAGVLMSCFKWRLILALDGIAPPLGRLLRWYLIGAFASNFLITEIGGDVGRGYLAGRFSGRPTAVARSIVIERLSGLIFMLLLGGLGALILLPGRGLMLGCTALALAVGALAWWLGRRVAHRSLVGGRVGPLVRRMPAAAQRLVADSRLFFERAAGQRATLAAVVALSLLFQLLAGFGIWLNMFAVGLVLPLWSVILAAALASVVSLLPVTINGWGVREGVLLGLLTPLGAPAATVLAGALLARALVLACSLVGAALLPLEASAPLQAPRT